MIQYILLGVLCAVYLNDIFLMLSYYWGLPANYMTRFTADLEKEELVNTYQYCLDDYLEIDPERQDAYQALKK